MWNWHRKVDVANYILAPLFLWGLLLQACDGLPLQSPASSAISLNAHQWQTMVRDAFRLMQKQHPQPQPNAGERSNKSNLRFMVEPSFSGTSNSGSTSMGTAGMVKLRNIRSGFGDMANVVRLVQLHELEKEWAQKARPRFGKRAEVPQENILPPYAFLDSKAEDYELARGDSKPYFPPEDYAEDGSDRELDAGQTRYSEGTRP